MTELDPDTARAALLVERARLVADVEETIQAPGQMTYGSQAAAASQVFEQQRDLALRDRATQQLELVDGALARLEAGTFGKTYVLGANNGLSLLKTKAAPASAWAKVAVAQKGIASGKIKVVSTPTEAAVKKYCKC